MSIKSLYEASRVNYRQRRPLNEDELEAISNHMESAGDCYAMVADKIGCTLDSLVGSLAGDNMTLFDRQRFTAYANGDRDHIKPDGRREDYPSDYATMSCYKRWYAFYGDGEFTLPGSSLPAYTAQAITDTGRAIIGQSRDAWARYWLANEAPQSPATLEISAEDVQLTRATGSPLREDTLSSVDAFNNTFGGY